MTKVLIVDDEIWMRRGIRSMLQSMDNKVKQIEEAEDGLEALQIMNKYKPDIVFVDIRMPGMDGLAFIERAIQIKADIKFIIISGYDDFQYVKQALAFQVIDYILKPIIKDELLKAFEKAYRLHKQENLNGNLHKQSHQSVLMLKEKLITDIINEKSPSSLNQLDLLGVDLKQSHFICLALKVANSEQTLLARGKSEITLIYYIMKNYIAELLNQSIQGTVFINHNALQVLIYSDSLEKLEIEAKRVEVIHSVMAMVTRLKFFTVVLAYSQIHQGEAGIRLANKEAWEALKVSVIQPEENIVAYRPDYFSSPDIQNPSHKEKELHDCVIIGDHAGIENIVMGLFRAILKQKTSLPPIEKLFEIMWLLGEKWILEKAINRELLPLDDQIHAEFALFDSLDHLERTLVKRFILISDILQKNNHSDGKKAVEVMLNYIHAHYNENVTLSHLSNVSHLNMTYVSDLFKENVGMNFIVYLTKVRMEKACEYLKHHKIMVNQVANLVGFEDERYFSTVFKKTYKMTPKEYRSLHQS